MPYQATLMKGTFPHFTVLLVIAGTEESYQLLELSSAASMLNSHWSSGPLEVTVVSQAHNYVSWSLFSLPF